MTNSEKRKWIKALEEVIIDYETLTKSKFIEKDIQKWRRKLCPLCILVRTDCALCIHNSKFGSGISCMYQKSFKRIAGNTITIPFINYRISYLNKIINKIKADMK